MVRDRLITSGSFQNGLTRLGFKMSDEETAKMFKHLDANGDGAIDLLEFTRFCLEIPSMTWKAERARRGLLGNNPGVQGDRELDKAAQDMANEAINANDETSLGQNAWRANLEPLVDLGKTIYRGEKFFWRTKDLIEVVIQLNETKGLLAVSTFHTERLKTYPIIFVDPAKIPAGAAAEAEILKYLKSKQLAAKTNLEMGVGVSVGGGGGGGGGGDANKGEEAEAQANKSLLEKAHLAYIADYIVHRINLPDEHGNLLQLDLTRPEEEVNPSLSLDGKQGDSSSTGTVKVKRGTAAARPGLMRTTFDEWDTLLFPNPPSRVQGAPVFPETKKRESYFQEFCRVTEKFDEDRTKAQRLSGEAATFAMQVANTLAPLSRSASAPATLPLPLPLDGKDRDANPRPESGRIILTDDIASRRGSATAKTLLESQSAPSVRPSGEALAAVG